MHEVYENDVRFEETDAQGIVFYGNYVTYQDETFTEYMEAVGHPYDDTGPRGWDVHVVNVELNYHRPAAFRDHLTHATRVSAIEDSSIEFDYECRNADEELLVDGGVVHVAVDSETGEPIRVPEAFREDVVEFQSAPPEPV